MKNIFTPKENPKVRHNDVMVKCINTSTQGLRSLVPKIWNNLPSGIKLETSLRNILKPGSNRIADAIYA